MAKRFFAVPGTRLGRLVAGILLIIGGILGFLPILGFWMIPLGLYILSQDSSRIRRMRRRLTVKFGRRLSRWCRRNVPLTKATD